MKSEAKKVRIEEPDGPIEFTVRVGEFGSLKWGVGRYVVSGQPSIRLGAEFGKRLREAIKLIDEHLAE